MTITAPGFRRPRTSGTTIGADEKSVTELENLPLAPNRAGILRRLWKALPSIVVALIVAYFAWCVANNHGAQWPMVGQYLFHDSVLAGVRTTVLLTLASGVFGIVGGIVLAYLRLSRSPLLRALSTGYTAVFRSTPLLVQILFIYNLAIFFPTLSIGIPFSSITASVETNSVIGGFTASLLALGLHEAAYMGEIMRGSISGVAAGQQSAALSLGMTRRTAFRRIIFPQAVRTMVPPVSNQLIGLLKATALVSVVGAGDLLTHVQLIYQVNYAIIPLLIVATIWYMALTLLATLCQQALERRLDVDHTPRPSRPRLDAVLSGLYRRRAAGPTRAKETSHGIG